MTDPEAKVPTPGVEAESVQATPIWGPAVEESIKKDAADAQAKKETTKLLSDVTLMLGVENDLPVWDDIVDDELVNKETKAAMKLDRGKKYLDNAVKICISFPSIIKTNKEILADLMKLYEEAKTDNESRKLKEDIVATKGQIDGFYAQIEALAWLNDTYKTILTELNAL